MATTSSGSAAKSSRHSGRSCVAGTHGGASCTNTQYTEGVSMHSFPDKEKYPKQHQEWVRFVRRHRPGFVPSKHSPLCCIHFEDSCYVTRRDIAKDLGIRVVLKPDAVPTIDSAIEAEERTPTIRERKQVIRSLVQEETSSAATSQAKSEAVEPEGEAAQEVQEHVASKPQETVESPVEEKEEQIKSLKRKIHSMQKENWTLRKQKRSLQTAFNESTEMEDQPSTSKKDELSTEAETEPYSEDFDVEATDVSTEDTDWSSMESYHLSADDCEDIDDNGDDVDITRNTVSVDPNTEPHDEPKFIVFFGMLLGLFTMFCFKCKSENPTATIKRIGTMATVVQSCKKCGNTFIWRSQPLIQGRHPAGNIMLSFSILMSGVNISQAFLMFKHLGLKVISPRTYFFHQKKFLFPAVFLYWEKYQKALLDKIKGLKGAVEWSGDGRFDSMGHNAKYGVYTMFCNSISKLAHFELLQANQTGNSNAMELAGAKSCFKYLQNQGIEVSIFVSDRHLGIAKWIRESQPDTRHFNDLWHVMKGITKKLTKAGKEKGNEKLLVWVKAIRSHLYWCALSTKQGFGDLIVAKWKSVIRHIANLHTNHPDSLYANCPHGPLEPRDWIKQGTQAHERLHGILMKPRTIKDIKMVSSDAQTSCLEGFHSTLNHWHPKMIHYSWLGTYCRHILAIMHFNENVHREKRQTKAGTVYYNVIYPKYKFGEEVVREIAVPPTYDYVNEVKKVLFTANDEERAQALKKYVDHQPPPLNTQFGERLPKPAAIERQQQRKSNVTQLFPSEAEQSSLLESTIAAAAASEQQDRTRSVRRCRKCKKPMKGHRKGQCS